MPCRGSSPNTACLVCPTGDVWKHVPLRDPDSAVSLSAANPPGQPPRSHPFTKSWAPTRGYNKLAKREAITPLELVNSSLLLCRWCSERRSRQRDTSEAGTQETPSPDRGREASSLDGRCLDNGMISWFCQVLSFLTQPHSLAQKALHNLVSTTTFGHPPSFFAFLLVFPDEVKLSNDYEPFTVLNHEQKQLLQGADLSGNVVFKCALVIGVSSLWVQTFVFPWALVAPTLSFSVPLRCSCSAPCATQRPRTTAPNHCCTSHTLKTLV